MRYNKYVRAAAVLLFLSGILALFIACSKESPPDAPPTFQQAMENGKSANEGFRRCQRYVTAWLALADPKCGLIPRNLEDRYWNTKDVASDNYPFLVLSTYFTDRSLFETRAKEMLATEIRLTSRVGCLPDTYDFAKSGFSAEKPNLPAILFGATEYTKDGSLLITEWMGPSPWRDRMMSLLDDIWKYAPAETPGGNIISKDDIEVNGVMLQVLPRIYWMTGDEKYLNWAVRLGDYYLLGNHHPTRDTASLRLRDHGNEVISGLCDLYATVHFVRPDKARAYREPLHVMLDRILEVGRNRDGLFYDVINPQTGSIITKRLSDNWGYILNGFYTVYLVDGTEAYRQAVLKVLSVLPRKYRGYPWEKEHADGYADSIEGALYLYNRERLPATADWLDSEIRVLWGKQKSDGIIEAYHCDGNFARTTLMYCLWKTRGVSIQPWRGDVVFGCVQSTDAARSKGAAKSPGRVDSRSGADSGSGVKSAGAMGSSGGSGAVPEGGGGSPGSVGAAVGVELKNAMGSSGSLLLAIRAEKDWQGKILFDPPRHKTIMKLPLDWPRINHFAEWFTVDPESRYTIRDATASNAAASNATTGTLTTGGTATSVEQVHTGRELIEGFPIALRAGEERHLEIQKDR